MSETSHIRTCGDKTYRLKEQVYSPSTCDTLTVVEVDGVESPKLEEQVAWMTNHPDAVLIWSEGVACQ